MVGNVEKEECNKYITNVIDITYMYIDGKINKAIAINSIKLFGLILTLLNV